jgi:hypothetical protein
MGTHTEMKSDVTGEGGGLKTRVAHKRHAWGSGDVGTKF